MAFDDSSDLRTGDWAEQRREKSRQAARRLESRLVGLAELQAGVRCIECKRSEPPVWFGLCERCAIDEATSASEMLWETPFADSDGASEKR